MSDQENKCKLCGVDFQNPSFIKGHMNESFCKQRQIEQLKSENERLRKRALTEAMGDFKSAYEDEIDQLKKQLETTEAERKRYHKEFCQERQRVIDGKPSIKHEKEIIRLRQQLDDLKSAEFRALEVAGCMVHEIALLKNLLAQAVPYIEYGMEIEIGHGVSKADELLKEVSEVLK